jgi:hypothetical protein
MDFAMTLTPTDLMDRRSLKSMVESAWSESMDERLER